MKASKKALRDKSTVLLAAKTDTVGNACMIRAFYFLNSWVLKDKLVSELMAAWPDQGLTRAVLSS